MPMNPAVESLRAEQRAQRQAAHSKTFENELDDALEGTFPASDPVAMQAPVTIGAAKGASQNAAAGMALRPRQLEELILNEVRARPFRALGWAAAAGILFGLWAAK